MNIYVGNLSHDVTQDELHQAFAAHGEVSSASIITDKFSGQSRGFGFVEMPKNDEAQAAITALNGMDLKGRPLNVNVARPRNDRPRSSGGRSW
jgi:RNA recognition motif-containing protein